jgi:hypothetical protein
MLHRLRIARSVAGLLVLAVFTAWLGLASLHHHGNSTPCEICKVLQVTHATLPGGPPVLQRSVAAQRLAATARVTPHTSAISIPLGRAPPSA